jgi:phenylpropionate dioxygenase-like ring-hydroxylating dioxygenase large terminal subunit
MTCMAGDAWTAVTAAHKLRQRPRRIIMDNRPVVLFRHGKGLAALSDICPHRQAPLSEGRVTLQGIECPYHGWRFDAAGACRGVPGHLGEPPRCTVPSYAVREQGGLVFVASQPPNSTPYVHARFATKTAQCITENRVRARLADVAENILDATHTHFIHKGLLRGLSERRYRVTVRVTGGADWVEARYEGEPRQEGLISKLLEGERSLSVGRFRAPAIAEIEFWGEHHLKLVTTFHLRQATPTHVYGIALLTGPRQGGLGYLKAAVLLPLFHIAVAQDRAILETAHRQREFLGLSKAMPGPVDILRPHIDAILAGQRPSVADRPQVLDIEL